MTKLTTASVGLAVTPTFIKTFFSHVSDGHPSHLAILQHDERVNTN